MSWVSSPRAGYGMGDPGLFSFLGKAIGSVANVMTGGLAGTAYSAVKAIASKRPAPAGPAYLGGSFTQSPIVRGGTQVALRPSALAMPGGAIVRADSVKTRSTSIAGGLYQSGETTVYGPTAGGVQPGQPTGRCVLPSQDGRSMRIKATHANKSGYYVHPRGQPESATYVAPGTRCVANRRRNPLNPRSLSRAMSRIHGARKAISHLIRFESQSRGGKMVFKRPAKRRSR